MKISTKLKGSAVLIIGITFIFVGAVLYVSIKAGQAGERNQIAQKILETSVMGVALRIEYGLTGEDRPKVQWYALQANLNNILDQAAPLFTEPANQTLYTAIRDNQERKKVTFDAVVSAIERGDNPELVARLNSQLAVTVQNGVSISTRLAELSREEHGAFHQMLKTIIGGVGLFVIFFALISYFVSRRISSSLTTLQQEFARIASLDFSATTTTTTTNDEIGQLASAFNKMAEKLKKSYGSLETKAKELADIAKEKESVRLKLAVTAEELATTATEKEDVRKKLAITAKELAVIAEEKEDVRRKLVATTDKLAREEKLAVIGKLAGIMGHEIRNPLGVIRNSIYFLNLKFKESIDEKVKRHMDILETEIDACDKIISDVLEFARTRPPAFTEAEINSVVETSISNSNIPKTIKVEANLGESLPKINIDIAQVKQVFSNIISNAIEAMPKGGELRVTTSQTDTFVSITFKDSGGGIPKGNFDKLFTPLFSTKTKGLGLGLAACQNIIVAHHGKIEFESKEGQWTTFTVTLPIYKN